MIDNQKGIAQVIVVIVLIVGLLAALYLVKNPTVFKSRAANESRLEVQGNFYNNGVATSRLLSVRPTYGGAGTPTYYRLADTQDGLERGTVFPYDSNDETREFVLWNLGLEDSDAPGQGVGNHQIYTQFLVDGKWTTPLPPTNIRLEPVNTVLKLAVSCDYQTYVNGMYSVTVKWDTDRASNADSIVMMVFRGQGGFLSDTNGSMNPQVGSFTFGVPSLSANYSIFATTSKAIPNTSNSPTEGVSIVDTSELSFSCTNQATITPVTNLEMGCTDTSCNLKWNGGSKMTEVTSYLLDPVTQAIVSPTSTVASGNTAKINLSGGNYTQYSVIALQPTTDPQAAGLITKYPSFSGKVSVSKDSPTLSSGPAICGYVKGSTGSGVAGVKVEVRNDTDITPQVATTDSSGKFSVGGFITKPAAVYSVRVPNQVGVHATTNKYAFHYGLNRETQETDSSYEMQRYQLNDCASAVATSDGVGSCRCNFGVPQR